MLHPAFDALIVWWLLTLALWVGIPAGIVYAVRRFLRTYERRTQALARADALELRVARLEAELAGRAPGHPVV